MKAVVCQNGELRVETLPDPVPEQGHALLSQEQAGQNLQFRIRRK